MERKSTQTTNGKAFEFALLEALNNRLRDVTTISIVEDASYETAVACHRQISVRQQNDNLLAANKAVEFLLGIEPRLSHGRSPQDVLQLRIMPDQKGQEGDVRDVLTVRDLQGWEIGISAKHNHRALKHSRLSQELDFGEKWLGYPCSADYFREITSVFERLTELKQNSGGTARWNVFADVQHEVYRPVLAAFKREIVRIVAEHADAPALLISYLVGNKDFYKVIKDKKKVLVEGYNLQGTLNQSFPGVRPTTTVSKLKLPARVLEIDFKPASNTTLIITFDGGWVLSFRLHSAKSTVESSLKFDVNLEANPHSLFTNHIIL